MRAITCRRPGPGHGRAAEEEGPCFFSTFGHAPREAGC